MIFKMSVEIASIVQPTFWSLHGLFLNCIQKQSILLYLKEKVYCLTNNYVINSNLEILFQEYIICIRKQSLIIQNQLNSVIYFLGVC